MKKRIGKVSIVTMALFLSTFVLAGCSAQKDQQELSEELQSDNVIITETGEILEKDNPDTEEAAQATPTPLPEGATEIVDASHLDLKEPEQEQIISEEDQTEPQGYELQLVFLGDSIFDNNRDGTGIPYLTSVKCGADVYNLAIGGTSATLENGEESGNEDWTSRSLQGVVKAMMGQIPTDIFEGTRTKEILDNPNVDFSRTDYFIVEYGINDFLRAMPLNNSDDPDDRFTYAGALRCALSDLKSLAPDATIIVCSPHYCQFYSGDWMIGDSNSVNTGHGTLFDYVGTCNYVANEQQTVLFNAHVDLGIDGYTADEYLEDGIHLTAAGRELYAEALAQIIRTYEETKNN